MLLVKGLALAPTRAVFRAPAMKFLLRPRVFLTARFQTNGAITSSRTESSDRAVDRTPEGRGQVFEAYATSGVPLEVTRRSVKIYKPSKTAQTSGTTLTHDWKLDFDVEERWENPLMGWASSADPVQSVRMTFPTKEAAIQFAERNGYDWEVEEPKRVAFRVKSYAENYKWIPEDKIRLHKTK